MNESLLSLHDYHDAIILESRLFSGGELSESVVREKADMIRSCAATLLGRDIDPQAEAHGFFVPGRIEVLGKHTDYAGGRSILAAAEKGFCFVATPRDDEVLNITDVGSCETISFSLGPELTPQLGHWSNYPQTVARRVSRNFTGPLRGCNVAFLSDLPPASGMSSSSAMMVGFFLILSKINQLEQQEAYRENIQSKEDLAGYLGTVENGQSFKGLTGDKGVGTFGGSEDHTAILCSQSNQLRQYSYCPVRFEKTITVPEEYVFAIASSGVVAEKTGAALEKYNRASRLANRIVKIWQDETGDTGTHLAALVNQTEKEYADIVRFLESREDSEFSPKEFVRRFAHFYQENYKIIPQAVAALEAEGIEEFGRQVDISQLLAQDILGNQIEETVFLARAARELDAAAASSFGAGFGGSVWALIEQKNSESFLTEWEQCYIKKFSQHSEQANFFITRAGPAALPI